MEFVKNNALMNSAIGIMEIVSYSLALHIVWSIDWEIISIKTNVIILTAREISETVQFLSVHLNATDNILEMEIVIYSVILKNVTSTAQTVSNFDVQRIVIHF